MGAKANKERYDRLKAQGLCTRCGKNPAILGKTLCVECREKANKRRETQRENNLCTWCGKPSDGGSVCKECLDKRKEDRVWLGEHGFCTRCRVNKAAPGRKQCDKCLERGDTYREEQRKTITKEKIDIRRLKSMEKYAKNKENGLCRCGRPVFENYCECYECHIAGKRRTRERSSKRSNHYKELGLCIWCGAERKKGYYFCPSCYEKKKAQALKMRESPKFKESQEKQRPLMHYKYFVGN